MTNPYIASQVSSLDVELAALLDTRDSHRCDAVIARKVGDHTAHRCRYTRGTYHVHTCDRCGTAWHSMDRSA